MNFNSYPPSSIIQAPFIEAAIPYDIPTLEKLIKRKPTDCDLLLSFGNLLFHNKDYNKATSIYKKINKIEANNHKGHANLGITMLLLGKSKDALISLNKALKLAPDCKISIYNHALASTRLGKIDDVIDSLNSLIADEPNNPLSLGLLGGVYFEKKDFNKARSFLKQAFELNLKEHIVENLLELELEDFKTKFNKGDFVSSSKELHKLSLVFGDLLLSNKELVDSFSITYEKIQNEGLLDSLIEEFRSSKQSSEAYKIFCCFYFSLGLIPEFFMEEAKLNQELEKWQQANLDRGDHPYAHFAMGVCYSYMGKLDDALEKIMISFDKLLPKKQESLRLKEIEKFLKFILRIGEDSLSLSDASENEWKEAGFETEFQIRLWRNSGFSPDEAKKWNDFKVSAKLAQELNKLGLTPEDASPYIEAEITNAKNIRSWSKGKVSSETASEWEKESTLPVGTAVQLINSGITDPKVAMKWMELFSFPGDAITWHSFGFSPEEAKKHIASGITSPSEELKNS